MGWSLPRFRREQPQTAAPAATDDAPLFDEASLARLRRLSLLPKKTIAEGLAGEHRSRRHGASPEFADFKSYTQGDDFRRIDWSIYARLDELFVRLSEITTEMTVHVLLDTSKSMDWRGESDRPTKFDYARRIAGSLGYVSLWRHDRVMILPFGQRLGTPFGPAHGRARAVPMLHYLNGLAASGETDLAHSVERYLFGRSRPGLLILISDLLSGEPDDFAARLHTLRARGWQTMVVHVVDPAEIAPEALLSPDPTELIDLESGERLVLASTEDVLNRYRQEIGGWLEGIERAAEAERTDYFRLQTDWPFESIVLQLLHRRGLVA
jgi:uncharacterized protein (DUF58 family)